MEKKIYYSPVIDIKVIYCDVITFSETEEWDGPVISAGNEDEN